MVGDVYGVVKAYTTRVGDGPFPTELTDDLGAWIQKVNFHWKDLAGQLSLIRKEENSEWPLEGRGDVAG